MVKVSSFHLFRMRIAAVGALVSVAAVGACTERSPVTVENLPPPQLMMYCPPGSPPNCGCPANVTSAQCDLIVEAILDLYFHSDAGCAAAGAAAYSRFQMGDIEVDWETAHGAYVHGEGEDPNLETTGITYLGPTSFDGSWQMRRSIAHEEKHHQGGAHARPDVTDDYIYQFGDNCAHEQ